ncbi:MAG: hypothetical protein KGV51_06035 [Moraxellaceae bacterium]|nr:hypothetical protein [Moraxellaceae bacterium]
MNIENYSKFWKLSQGAELFKLSDIIHSINSSTVYVHKCTPAKGRNKKTQAQEFIDAPVDDYFYLTHGNEGIYLIGQFIGQAKLPIKGEKWLERKFKLICASNNIGKYINEKKRWWEPNDNSTFINVQKSQLLEFEQKILTPYFDKKLTDF